MMGKTFGDLTVVGVAERGSDGARWLCACVCGGTTVRSGFTLRRAKGRSSCSSCKGLRLAGQRFGRLLAIRVASTLTTGPGHTDKSWLCQCDCGELTTVRGYLLKNGTTVSCGCEIKRGQARYMQARYPRTLVYVVQIMPDGPVKIGCAENVVRRLGQMKVDCPFPIRVLSILDGGYPLESRLHELFKSKRVGGEWFEPADDVMALELSRNDWAEEVRRDW